MIKIEKQSLNIKRQKEGCKSIGRKVFPNFKLIFMVAPDLNDGFKNFQPPPPKPCHFELPKELLI